MGSDYGVGLWTRQNETPHSAMGSTMGHYGLHYGLVQMLAPAAARAWVGVQSECILRACGPCSHAARRASNRNGARRPEPVCRVPRAGRHDCPNRVAWCTSSVVRSSVVRSSLVRSSECDATERGAAEHDAAEHGAIEHGAVPWAQTCRARRAAGEWLRLRAGGAPQCEWPGAQHAC